MITSIIAAVLAGSARAPVQMETRSHGVTPSIDIVESDIPLFPSSTVDGGVLKHDFSIERYGRVRCLVGESRLHACKPEAGSDYEPGLSQFMIKAINRSGGFREFARDLHRQGAAEVDIATRFSLPGSNHGACIVSWCSPTPLPPPPPTLGQR